MSYRATDNAPAPDARWRLNMAHAVTIVVAVASAGTAVVTTLATTSSSEQSERRLQSVALGNARTLSDRADLRDRFDAAIVALDELERHAGEMHFIWQVKRPVDARRRMAAMYERSLSLLHRNVAIRYTLAVRLGSDDPLVHLYAGAYIGTWRSTAQMNNHPIYAPRWETAYEQLGNDGVRNREAFIKAAVAKAGTRLD